MSDTFKPQLNETEKRVFDELLDSIGFKIEKQVNILVVVDSPYIWQSNQDNSLALKNVIDSITSSFFGFLNFEIHIATREGKPALDTKVGPYTPRYSGFRFDMKIDGRDVIDDYQQLWLLSSRFTGNPDEDPNPGDTMALIPNDAELATLTAWMNEKQGGIFASGLHEAVGANMSYRIPRIRSMRRWTMANGSPFNGGQNRVETLRPNGPPQDPIYPSTHNYDTSMQPLQWVVIEQEQVGAFTLQKRPHSILCHPQRGPIDVMPDDAAEGLCYDNSEIQTNLIYDFDGSGPKAEYPPGTNGTITPIPKVIAYGSTLGSPPYNLASAQIARPQFPLLNAYDGHKAGVGRCVTQSSYMHWHDSHTNAIKQENGESWEKVSRFYLNVAAWLCPPGYVNNDIIASAAFLPIRAGTAGRYSSSLSDQDLGQRVKAELVDIYGTCLVTESLLEYFLDMYRESQPFDPPLDQCLTCLPFKLVEHAMLAGVVRQGIQLANDIRQVAFEQRGQKIKKIRSLQAFILSGAQEAVQRLAENTLRENANQRTMWERLAFPEGS